MPTYEYLCQQCGKRLEVFQKFSAKPLRVHDECGGALQKVFHASGVVFKGSGYYVTDSRNGSKSGSPDAPVKSDSKKEKAPAEAKASESASVSDSKKSDSKKSDSKKSDTVAAG